MDELLALINELRTENAELRRRIEALEAVRATQDTPASVTLTVDGRALAHALLPQLIYDIRAGVGIRNF